MTDLKLEVGEGILLQTTDAGRYDGNNEISIDELYLTNRYLICVYEKTIGLFKTETVVDKIPLSSIAVINGIVQLQQVDDDDYGKSLQIIYTSGKRELLELNVSPKKQYPVWKDAISGAVMRLATDVSEPQQAATPPTIPIQEPEFSQPVTAEPVEPIEHEESKAAKPFSGVAIFAGFKSVVDTAKQTLSEVTQTVIEKVPGAPIASPPMSEPTPIEDIPPIPVAEEEKKEGKIMFCSNCGTKLNDGAKFCHGCGSPVNAVPVAATPEPPVQQRANPHERQQEYVGKILKCPHCGNPVTEREVVCSACGMEITGRSAVLSVQAFKDQLMAIEMTRKKSKFIDLYSQAANPADTQKLSLIRSFPIPNTIDDIQEFMLLAVANVDSKLSKNTAGGKFNSFLNSGNVNLTMQKTLSDAWVSKMQQAYQKAEIMFPNDPVFRYIQKIYFDKMKELKIKIK